MSVYPHPASLPPPGAPERLTVPSSDCHQPSIVTSSLRGWPGADAATPRWADGPIHGPVLHTHTASICGSPPRARLTWHNLYGSPSSIQWATRVFRIYWGGFEKNTYNNKKIKSELSVISKFIFFLHFDYGWITIGLKVVHSHHKAFIWNGKWTCKSKITGSD